MQKRAGFFVLDLIPIRHGRIRSDFAASAREVTLRLARPDERVRWDALMDERHYLGFRQFAGRGLRYVAEYQKQWLALIGWQSGAFKCRPREPLDRLAPAAAVPPLAADCQQHPNAAAVSAARGSQPVPPVSWPPICGV